MIILRVVDVFFFLELVFIRIVDGGITFLKGFFLVSLDWVWGVFFGSIVV